MTMGISICFQVKCPVRILHAYEDAEWNWNGSVKMLEMFQSEDVDLILRKQGNHRLMKSRDLTLLTYVLGNLLSEIQHSRATKSKL